MRDCGWVWLRLTISARAAGHHRLIHSNGCNRSDVPRMAILCDFQRSERPMVTQFSREACSLRLVAEREAEGKAGPGETSVLWMMNTREFVDNWAPRDVRLSALGLYRSLVSFAQLNFWTCFGQDMWEDWAI